MNVGMVNHDELNVVVISIQISDKDGKFTSHNGKMLSTYITWTLNAGFIIDLSGVRNIDPTSIYYFNLINTGVTKSGGRLIVCGMIPNVQGTFNNSSDSCGIQTSKNKETALKLLDPKGGK